MATSSITANFAIRDEKEAKAFISAGFVMLLNRDTFDYTEWRKDNLFPGETVDSLCGKIEEFQAAQRDRTLA